MTTQILQVHREFLKSEDLEEYRQVEGEISRQCSQWKCPHPYLALESLTGPKEVWYLNGYSTREDIEQRVRDYTGNVGLLAALRELGRKKAELLRGSADVFAHHRRGGWKLGEGRFLVVATVTAAGGPTDFELDGTRFEAEDGSAFHLWAAETRAYAEALASRVGAEARVFAVRPEWSYADPEWEVAEPALWRTAAG
ncbi:MAG: hypothetical protein ABI995_10195 [Acidobacteriota bacterium]